MRRTLAALVVLVLCAAVALILWRHSQDTQPKRVAVHALERFDAALRDSSPTGLLQQVVMSAALTGRTPAEQTEFLRKALADEISAAGIAALAKEGAYGPLTNLFPETGQKWAAQAGVSPADCVAFRMEKDGIVAEAVLATNPLPPRLLRCNNVKRMAP